MADVLIVCVSDDVELAEKLADLFDGLGYDVSDDTDELALRHCGAGIVVWSRAAMRSRPFRLTAQRLIDAGKAVAAIGDETPAPDYLPAARAFSVGGWSGEANDPAIDPLFFAVDRLVSAATHTVTPIRVVTPVLRHTRRVSFAAAAAPVREAAISRVEDPAPREDVVIELTREPAVERPEAARPAVNVRDLAAAASRRIGKINPAGAAIAVMLVALIGAGGWNSATNTRDSKAARRDNAVTLTAALVDPRTVDMSDPPAPVRVDLPSPREPASAPHFAVHGMQRTAAHTADLAAPAPDADAAAPHWASWSGVPAPTQVSYVPAG